VPAIREMRFGAACNMAIDFAPIVTCGLLFTRRRGGFAGWTGRMSRSPCHSCVWMPIC